MTIGNVTSYDSEVRMTVQDSSLVAAADPAWFTDPQFGADGDTDSRLSRQEPDRPEESVAWGAPLTITADGQVYGHAALWGRCHVGYGGTCVTPPKEPKAYTGFLVGEGPGGVPTGPIVIDTGHAPLSASGSDARSHYDDTGRAVADVTVGTDEHGIWVAGAVRNAASEDDVDVLRGSAISGDWRDMGRGLQLVGLLAVNGPGFRVNRSHAMAASASLQTVGPACEECGSGAGYADRLDALEDQLGEVKRLLASAVVAAVD